MKGLQYLVAKIWMALLVVMLSAGVIAAPRDFEEAKRLSERVYADHPEEFYCGCRITWRNGGKDLVDLNACGYTIRKDPTRAQRIEWEHVVPASWFGQAMTCWQQGGRQNCTKRDEKFQRMEADMHNLTPSVGEVNGDRGNLPFGLVAPDKARYGRCETRVDMIMGRVEPRDKVKGDAARIVFYMMSRYQVPVDDKQLALLRQWAEQDPVDAWELERDKRIGQHMGWRNPYVAQAGKLALPTPKMPISAPKASLPETIDASKSRLEMSHLPSAPTPGGNALQVRGNRNSKLYHLGHCPGFPLIKPSNRVEFSSIAQAEAQGYRRAGNCRD